MIRSAFALPRAEWKTIGLVGLGLALTPFYQTAFSFALVPITGDLDVSPADFVVAVQVFAVAAGAALFPAGILADRFGAGAVFVAGLALSPVALALVTAFPGYWSLLGFGLLRELSAGAVWSAGYVILATRIGAERRGRAFGMRNLFIVIGTVAAPLAIVQLMSLDDWRTAFSILGAVGIVCAAVAMRFRGAFGHTTLRRRQETGTPKGMRTGFRMTTVVLATSPVLLFLVALTLLNFSDKTSENAAKTFEQASSGRWGTLVDARLVLQASALVFLLGVLILPILAPLIGGVLADRIANRERLVAICLAAFAISLGIAALDILPVPIELWLALGVALVALASPSIDLLVLRICPPGRIGAVFGFVATGGPLGGALGFWSAGVLTGHGMPETVFGLSALALLPCIVCIYAARAVAR